MVTFTSHPVIFRLQSCGSVPGGHSWGPWGWTSIETVTGELVWACDPFGSIRPPAETPPPSSAATTIFEMRI